MHLVCEDCREAVLVFISGLEANILTTLACMSFVRYGTIRVVLHFSEFVQMKSGARNTHAEKSVIVPHLRIISEHTLRIHLTLSLPLLHRPPPPSLRNQSSDILHHPLH